MDLPIEFKSLLDIHDQPVVLIDGSHRVIALNTAFEDAYGVRTEQAANTPCYELLAGAQRPCPCGPQGQSCPFAVAFTEERTCTTVHRHQDAEGREHVLRIQAYPIRTQSGDILIAESVHCDAAHHHPTGLATGCPNVQMVGASAVYREAQDRLMMAAGTDAPVLLLGDTGTGKELAAEFIHRQSGRRSGPFKTLDCTVLTAELFESEVFGHERGAFTGSVRDKPGLFELADKGTLFIDEIGELPLPLQAKLLRLLETGTFRRVGSTETRHANVRLICATNRELQNAAWFRSDLYYRIACVTVRLPRLAERRSDIRLLAAEILQRIGRSSGRRITLDGAAVELLHAYDFPGNIRELRNILWVASVNAANGQIDARHVAMAMPQTKPQARASPEPDLCAAPPSTMLHLPREPRLRRSWNRDELAHVMHRNRGNRRAAAHELGVSERTIYRKLREFGLGCLMIGALCQLMRFVTTLETLPIIT